jgi:hypothetical protein
MIPVTHKTHKEPRRCSTPGCRRLIGPAKWHYYFDHYGHGFCQLCWHLKKQEYFRQWNMTEPCDQQMYGSFPNFIAMRLQAESGGEALSQGPVAA